MIEILRIGFVSNLHKDFEVKECIKILSFMEAANVVFAACSLKGAQSVLPWHITAEYHARELVWGC